VCTLGQGGLGGGTQKRGEVSKRVRRPSSVLSLGALALPGQAPGQCAVVAAPGRYAPQGCCLQAQGLYLDIHVQAWCFTCNVPESACGWQTAFRPQNFRPPCPSSRHPPAKLPRPPAQLCGSWVACDTRPLMLFSPFAGNPVQPHNTPGDGKHKAMAYTCSASKAVPATRRSSYPTPTPLGRASTRPWHTCASSAAALGGTPTPSTSCMALMRIWSCWRWQRTSLTFTSCVRWCSSRRRRWVLPLSASLLCCSFRCCCCCCCCCCYCCCCEPLPLWSTSEVGSMVGLGFSGVHLGNYTSSDRAAGVPRQYGCPGSTALLHWLWMACAGLSGCDECMVGQPLWCSELCKRSIYVLNSNTLGWHQMLRALIVGGMLWAGNMSAMPRGGLQVKTLSSSNYACQAACVRTSFLVHLIWRSRACPTTLPGFLWSSCGHKQCALRSGSQICFSKEKPPTGSWWMELRIGLQNPGNVPPHSPPCRTTPLPTGRSFTPRMTAQAVGMQAATSEQARKRLKSQRLHASLSSCSRWVWSRLVGALGRVRAFVAACVGTVQCGHGHSNFKFKRSFIAYPLDSHFGIRCLSSAPSPKI